MITNYEDFIKKNKDELESGKITKKFIKDLFDLKIVYKEGYEYKIYCVIYKIIENILYYLYISRSDKYKSIIRELCFELKCYKNFSSIWDSISENLSDEYKETVEYLKVCTGFDQFPENIPEIFTKNNLTDFNIVQKYLEEKYEL